MAVQVLAQSPEGFGHGANVFSTENGDIYIVVIDEGREGVAIMKSVDRGNTWQTASIIDQNDIFPATMEPQFVAGALGANGIVHVAVISGIGWQSGQYEMWGPLIPENAVLVYRTFDTNLDEWCGSWENVGYLSCGSPFVSYVGSSTNGYYHDYLSLAMDINSKPHLAWWGGVDSNGTKVLFYTNRTSGSWSGADVLHTHYPYSPYYYKHAMFIHSGTVVEIMYSLIGTGTWRRTRSAEGVWGNEVAMTYSVAPDPSYFTYTSGSLNRYQPDNSLYRNNVQESWGEAVDTGDPINSVIKYFPGGVEVCAYQRSGFYSHKYSYKLPGKAWSTPIEWAYQTMYGVTGEWGNYFNYEVSRLHILYCVGNSGPLYYTYIKPPVYSSFHAYICAGIVARGSFPAYIRGAGAALYPDSDISVGLWTNETGGSSLYPSLRDSSDDTYAWYDNATSGSYFEVHIKEPAGEYEPNSNVNFQWRGYLKAGNKKVTLRCELRQGSSVIATDDRVLTAPVQQFIRSLTPAETANITDVSDLRFRVTILSEETWP